MSTETHLQAAGVLALADLVRFQYFHQARRFWPIALFLVSALTLSLFGIVAVILTGKAERLVNPGLDWLILFFWAALCLLSPYWAAKRQLKNQQYLRQPMRYYFTTDRLRLEGARFSSEIEWRLVQRIYETKTAFLIYHSPAMAWILPRRFFWDDDLAVQRWREFAGNRLLNRRFFHGPGILSKWI